MANINTIIEHTLFVTHVHSSGSELLIWGQSNKDQTRNIESLIGMLKDSFDKGVGRITPQSTLIPNSICCAYHEDNYYRARIIKVQPDYNIFLHFIDYGNFEVIHPSQIRLLDDCSSGLKLATHPPIAFEFLLDKVIPFNYVWSVRIVDHIKHLLRYNEYPVSIATHGNRRIITSLYFTGQDFATYLVQNNMALLAPSEQVLSGMHYRLPNQSMMLKQPTPPIYRSPAMDAQSEAIMNINCHSKPRPSPINKIMPPPRLDHHENWRKPLEVVHISRPSPSVSPRMQDLPAFKSRNLEKGSVHEVFVSDVEDGPLKFSVQLQSCAQELETLMRNINSLPLNPLSQPPVPSSVYLGRSTKDKMLRRAVVSTVYNTLQAKVFYVDFGDQETLPHTDIYEIPPQYANPPLLSVRFTLSGVRDLNVTPEMKAYFKDLVLEKKVMLKVMPVEDSPLLHYGTLFINERSVLDILREQFPDSDVKFPDPPQLTVGSREYVHVSYIQSCNKFYVQLDKTILEQESLVNLLTQCVKIAPPIKPAYIKPGLKCLAHCNVDSQWYRAEVIKVTDTNVEVHYVDYGNNEEIPSNAIRSIRSDEVTKIPILAIQCCLNGFESEVPNTAIDVQFEEATLDKTLLMTVIAAQESTLIVNLIDINIKPFVNICDTLKHSESSNIKQSQPAIINHWQQQENNASSRTSRSKSEDSDKWTSKTQNESTEASCENSSFENVKIKNWKNSDNEEKRFNIRGGDYHSNRDWNNSSGDRFNRDNSRHDKANEDFGGRYNRNEFNDGNNRTDDNFSNNRYNREKSAGRKSDNRKTDKNSSGENNTWSDRDSNASSKSSGKRGRRGSGRGSDRNGRSGGRTDNARSSGRDQEGDDSNSNKYGGRSNDNRDYNKGGGGKFKGNNNRKFDRNRPNDHHKNDEIDSWNPLPSNKTDVSLQIPPPNITVGAIKHCEIVYITNPTDFYVQLIPDNTELDSLMEKIAELYENGGANLSELNVNIGMSCIAQYSEDLKWYRAEIQSRDSAGATIRFVDYGNTELVSYDKIKKIQSDFIKLPTQAIHAKLFAAKRTNWDDDEITKFTSLVDMKTLEAEFITLENDVYEILLREVVDNQPQQKYINEEFVEGIDLIQFKEEVKNKNRSTRSKSNQVAPDYAPMTLKWLDPVINPETTEDVIITWLTSPNDFHCQIVDKEDNFRNMMGEIQSVYPERQPMNDQPQVGTSVIAVFPEDGAFYRAEVLQLKPDGVIIRYVDFGNCAKVQQSKIYRVENRFSHLPKQAIRCTLKNVMPPNGSSWAGNSQEIDNIFNVEKLRCFFADMEDGKYVVSLRTNDTDLVDIMVNKGLAIYKDSGHGETHGMQNNEAKVDENVLHEDLSAIDKALLIGQLLKVKVLNVESDQQFYIEFPSANPKNSEIIQPGKVKCRLKDTISSNEQLKNLIGNKEVIIRVGDLDGDMFVVDVFDESGQKIKFDDNNQDEKISPLCPMPILHASYQVTVVHINHSHSVWLKRNIDTDTNTLLHNELYDYYSISGQPLNIKEGILCAALSPDENWYRARIVDKTDSGALVRYIDYGNTEELPQESLKELEPQFLKQFELAIEVSLEFTVNGTEIEQQNILNTHILNAELFAKLYRRNNKWFATLGMQPESKIEDDLELKALITYQNADFDKIQNENMDNIIDGNPYKVIVSHVDNPTQFWVQRVDDLTAIDELSNKLQREVVNYKSIEGVPDDKLICAVFNADRKSWFRAEVIDADEEIATVRFVDYGNTDVVMKISDEDEKIKYLPDSMKEIRFYAVKCRMNVIPISDEDWPSDVCLALEAKIKESSESVVQFIGDSNPKRVELFCDNESISDWLVTKNYALKIGANETIIDEFVESELDPKSAFVSHINSPSQFWVQEEKSVADLELIADRFLVADMFPKVNDIQIGHLYVAKYPEDSSWYRAQVISHNNNGTNVLYIDYGNSTMSTELREIPNDLTEIPPLSRKCRLELPEGVDNWSESACDEFIKMADDGATIFLLDVLQEGETSVVTLTLNGEDIVNHLKEFCEKCDKMAAEPSSQNDKIVFISHINSPNEFWVHEKDSTDDLEKMAKDLIDAAVFPSVEEMTDDLLCVAQFPEDSAWYRAQILSHGNTGTNVMYIDYGNSAVTTEIRKIPKDLAGIPPLAKKCSLVLPDKIDRWSEKSDEEFYKLWNDDTHTEFSMRIIEEAEASVVQLFRLPMNDDVTDYLLKFCDQVVPVIEERLSPLGEENSPYAVVSHVVSPAEFWIQTENQMSDLEAMAGNFTDIESFLPLFNFVEGTICAAKFPEDGAWYRAKILSHGDHGTEVLYIDYGNSAVSSELKALPNDLIHFPPLSKLCSLKMPETVGSWSKEACEKFIELVADGATMFRFSELKDLGENPTFISLVHNDEDVAESLALLCEGKILDEDNNNVQTNIKIDIDVEERQEQPLEPIESMGKNADIDSIDEDIYEKHNEDKTSSTSGVELTASDQSSSSHALGKLEPSPEIINSTMKVADEIDIVETVRNDSQISFNNNGEDESTIVLNSSTEQETEIKESTAILNVDESTKQSDIRTVKILELSTSEEILIRPLQPAEVIAANEDQKSEDVNVGVSTEEIPEINKDTCEEETKDAATENCKSKDLNLDLTKKDEKKNDLENDAQEKKSDDAVKCPLTPKTPHSEKFVAGVVSDHRIIEAEDDEIIEVTVVKKEPKK